jgi:hypothetical protein
LRNRFLTYVRRQERKKIIAPADRSRKGVLPDHLVSQNGGSRQPFPPHSTHASSLGMTSELAFRVFTSQTHPSLRPTATQGRTTIFRASASEKSMLPRAAFL